jgi:hypothetical protein
MTPTVTEPPRATRHPAWRPLLAAPSSTVRSLTRTGTAPALLFPLTVAPLPVAPLPVAPLPVAPLLRGSRT